MVDTMSAGESFERKGKALVDDLGSDWKELPVLVQSDEEEHLPSIFSWKSTEAADFKRPSGSAQHEESASYSHLELATKHKIFLSHSRQQRDFVEQLRVDLERKGYWFPFFDQRSHSLPKGKDFFPLIASAAKQCHVAVIVLSEKYLTSMWPMIELGKFCEAKDDGNPNLDLMPLFYKLSIDDLKEESKIESWMCKWKEYKQKHPELNIDVDKWRKAVNALTKANGFAFARQKTTETTHHTSKVVCRKAVVEEILKLSPPDFLFGASETMVGFDRLCPRLSTQFVEETTTGVLFLGLYGMSGLGKATMLKGMCDYFCKEMRGRVCYVDLSDSFTTELERQKRVLEKLCGFDKEALKKVHDADQGWHFMKEHLERERQPPVFLAIDNVTRYQHSKKEAREYLKAGFCSRSRIMITSNSRELVEELILDIQFCKPMPNLTEDLLTALYKTFSRAIRQEIDMSTLIDAGKQILVEQYPSTRKHWGRNKFDTEQQYYPFAIVALADYIKLPLQDLDRLLIGVNQGSLPL